MLGAGWVLVVLVATLWPFREPGLARAPAGGLPGLADVGRNVLLYAPLGFLLGFGRRRTAAVALLGAGLAAGVEIAQIAIPGRDASLADVAVDTLSVALGALLARHGWGSSGRWRDAHALAAGAFGAGVLLLPALALRPVAYSGDYYPAWTPDPPPHVHFPGRVVSARIGDVPVPPSGRSPAWETLGARLASGEPLSVRAVLDGPPGGVSPILLINGEGFELLLLAADRGDLVLRQRSKGDVLGLAAPLFTAAGSLRSVKEGVPFDLELQSDGLGWTVRVGDGPPVAVGPTPGSSWRLWVRSDDLSERVRRAIDALTVGLAFLAVGFWLRPSWTAGAGLAAVVGALLAGPELGGLLPTPAREWVAAGVGLPLGAGLGRLARRRAGPADQRGAIGPM